MFCRNCGAELREGAKFCVKCGKPIPQSSVTPNPAGDIPKVTPDTTGNISGANSNAQEFQKPVSPAGQPNRGTVTPQPAPMNNPPRKKSGAGLMIAIIVLVIFIFGAVGVTLYFTVFNDDAIEALLDDKDDEGGIVDTETEEPEEKESQKDGKKEEQASEQVAAESNTETDGKAADAEASHIIEDQTYKVDIVPHGNVKFVPYTPANAESDAVFKIMKKDQVVTVLPAFYENNSLAASGAVFVDVEEVFFKDYNIDGVEDIFVNCSYKYSADSSSTFMECRVYRGSAEGDYYKQTSLSNIGTEQAKTEGTIGYFVDELRDMYANYDLPYSNSISYSKEELEMLTEEQLMKARNEIYARHGYRFENPDLWKHFSNRDWYQPFTYTVPDSALNEHEVHNRDLILELEGKY